MIAQSIAVYKETGMKTKHACILLILSALFSFIPLSTALGATYNVVEYYDGNLAHYSIFATNSVWLREGAVIHSGNIGVLDASPGPWLDSQAEVSVGVGASLEDGTSIYGDSVKIKFYASVFNVYFNDLASNGEIRGEEGTPVGLPIPVTFPEFPEPDPGTEDVFLVQNESRILDAGRYGTVIVRSGATLILSGGMYHLENLFLGYSNTRVLVTAPIELIIEKRLDANFGAFFGPAEGSAVTARDIKIFVNGENGFTGSIYAFPKAVEIGAKNDFSANVYAPHGTIWIKENSNASGSFIGKDVLIGTGAHIKLDTYQDISSPPQLTLPEGYDEADLIVEESTMFSPERINYHFIPIGKIYEIGIAGQTHPDFGDEFAIVRYAYDQTALDEANFIEEFAVLYFDESAQNWKIVDKMEIDYENRIVTAYVSHFTPFVLTAVPASTGYVADPPPCIAEDYPDGIGGSGEAAFTVVDENFKYYQDRDYFIKPAADSTTNAETFALLGIDQALGIATYNGDYPPKYVTGRPQADHKLYTGENYIVFTAHTDLDVYLMYDTRGGTGIEDTSNDAPWIGGSGFEPTGLFIETTDAVQYYLVYKKSVLEGEVVSLHGNRREVTDPLINTNYWVIIKRKDDTSSGYASGLCVASQDTTPPAKVSNLNAFPGASSVTLTWQNPDDPDFAGVVIRRDTASPPMGVADGTAPTGTVVSPQSYKDTSVVAGVTYFFTVFSLDFNNNYEIGETVMVTTSADSDGDGLANDYETSTVYPNGLSTDPDNPDSDGDLVSDGEEVALGTDPTNPDVDVPYITEFVLESDSPTTNPVVEFALNGFDDSGITHWMITITSNKPLSSNNGWQDTKPSSYTLSRGWGAYELYAWAKDAAGNVSDLATKIDISYMVTWQKRYDGYGFGDTARSVKQTPDGKYIVTGYSDGTGFSDLDILTVKIDGAGNELGRLYYGETMYELGFDVGLTSDGGCVMAGSHGRKGDHEYLIVKTDAALTFEWSQTHDRGPNDFASSIEQTDDGGYIIAGAGDGYAPLQEIGGYGDVWILKLLANLSIDWEYIYDGGFGDRVFSVRQTANGGYIAAGYTNSSVTGSNDLLVMKIKRLGSKDPAGAVEWMVERDLGGDDHAYDVRPCADGGYIIAGSTNTNGGKDYYEGFLLKLDADGFEEWLNIFHFISPLGMYIEAVRAVSQTKEGGYITAGYIMDSQSIDVRVVKFDGLGSILWSRRYGDASDLDVADIAYSIEQTIDGGYIVAGGTGLGGPFVVGLQDNVIGLSSTADFWLLKIDPNGDIEGY